MSTSGVVVAVTGGIGSGKSTLCRLLVDFGATHIDADESARAALAAGTTAHAAVAAAFPDCVHDGVVDRAQLAARVFTSSADRQHLEGIVHPWIRDDVQSKMAAATTPVVVVEIPLLAETRSRSAARAEFAYVVDVWAPMSVRAERARTAGYSADDFSARVTAQASDSQRFAVADLVVPNVSDAPELRAHAAHVMSRVVGRSGDAR